MNLPSEHRADYDSLPPELRVLLDAELAAGNEVVEVGHSHPAPPVGCWFMLARRVTTRPRESQDGLSFYERNSSSHSGEFHTEKRHHFILEAPLPPPEPIDMDAAREAAAARQREADAARFAEMEKQAAAERGRAITISEPACHAPATNASGLVARFRESMDLDYERWKEGESYAIGLIAEATPAEKAEIEALLIGRGVGNWRDVEALTELGTPRAVDLLRATLAGGSKELAMAVLRRAPHLADEGGRTATLVAAIGEVAPFSGLTDTLLEVEDFHPPAVIDALLRGVLHREGGEPVHFAAMLMYLHGQAAAPFDWDQRPYFLKFRSENTNERIAMFRDLCARIGRDPGPFLTEWDGKLGS